MTAPDAESEQWDDPASLDDDDSSEAVIQFFVGVWITSILWWVLAALWMVVFV